MFLFFDLCKFCRNPQPSFTSPFRNILVITGQPRHGQRAVPEPADPGGLRALLLLAEQPEGVLAGRAVPGRAAGGELQLRALLHRRGPQVLPQRDRLAHGQHTPLLLMLLLLQRGSLGSVLSSLRSSSISLASARLCLVLLCSHHTLHLERTHPVTQQSVISWISLCFFFSLPPSFPALIRSNEM